MKATRCFLRCTISLFSIVIFLVIGGVAGAAPAASPGQVDPTFDPSEGGYWAGMLGPRYYTVKQITVTPDGKIAVGGSFDSVNGLNRRHIVRLDGNGGVDPTFRSPFVSWGQVAAVSAYPGGKLLIAGDLPNSDGLFWTRLLLLNADGSIDTAFQPQISDNRSVIAAAVDDQGRVLVSFIWVQGNSAIVRLLPNGEKDTSFQAPISPAVIVSIRPQADGKILVAGNLEGANRIIARLNEDGSLDQSFTAQIGYSQFQPSIRAVELQPDGKIIIGGIFDRVGGVACTNLARLNSDGSFDAGFGSHSLDNWVDDIAVQPDKRIIVTGSFKSMDGTTNLPGLARLLPDGSWDRSFDTKPFKAACDKLDVVQVALDANCKILLSAMYADNYGKPQQLVYRLQTNGAIDTTFVAPIGAAAPQIESVQVQQDGSLFVCGAFTGVRDQDRNGFVHLSRKGEVLPGWGIPVLNPGVGEVSVTLPDGCTIVGGTWQEFTDLGCSLFRFKPDGTLDPSWFYDAWVPDSMSTIHDMKLTPDGKLIVVGMNQRWASAVQKLLPDGSPDPAFHIPSIYGVDDIGVEKVLCQSDGGFFIAGEISSIDGHPARGFARLNADGTVDDKFAPLPSWVPDMITEPDGKIILAGSFTSANTNKTDCVRRLNPDGSIDTSFMLPDAVGGQSTTIALQKNGKILLGGSLEIRSGTNIIHKRLIRLLANGALDPDFIQGECNDIIRSIDLGLDGTIALAGFFSVYNGVFAPGVVCLIGDPVTPPIATRILPAVACPGDTLRVSIVLSLPTNAPSISLEETLPTGWTLLRVGNSGTYDPLSGKVHFLSNETPLTYDVMVPTNGLGAVAFSGSVTVGESVESIAGPTELTVVGPHPADRTPSDFVMSDSEVVAYASAWKTGQPWSHGPDPIPQNYVTRAGYLWRSQSSYTVVSGALEPPLCWMPTNEVPVPTPQGAALQTTAVRSVSQGYVEGMPFAVKVEVHPVSGTLAYTFEETLPENWVPVAGGGDFSFDQNHGLIKWGPFYDGEPRTLQYQVVPGVSTRMRQPLRGVVSCDGFDIAATGTTLLKRACHLRNLRVLSDGTLLVDVQGLGAPTAVVYVSEDLVNWTQLSVVDVGDGMISIVDPEKSGKPKRFYRVANQ